MSTSQNGWPVVGQSAVTDRAVQGVEFPNGWLKGDVDTVFTYLIGRLHREVESIDNGGCWGWFVKPIEGSTTISNHASGTAIDYNAPAHPMGSRNTYSAADRTRIRKILADLSGVVRWGGDYTGRPDDMHFEINKGRAAVAVVAAWIREQEDDVLNAQDKEWLESLVETRIDQRVPAAARAGVWDGALWSSGDPAPAAKVALQRVYNRVAELETTVGELAAAIESVRVLVQEVRDAGQAGS